MTSRRFIAHLEHQVRLLDEYRARRIDRQAFSPEERTLFGQLRRANLKNINDWQRTLDMI